MTSSATAAIAMAPPVAAPRPDAALAGPGTPLPARLDGGVARGRGDGRGRDLVRHGHCVPPRPAAERALRRGGRLQRLHLGAHGVAAAGAAARRTAADPRFAARAGRHRLRLRRRSADGAVLRARAVPHRLPDNRAQRAAGGRGGDRPRHLRPDAPPDRGVLPGPPRAGHAGARDERRPRGAARAAAAHHAQLRDAGGRRRLPAGGRGRRRLLRLPATQRRPPGPRHRGRLGQGRPGRPPDGEPAGLRAQPVPHRHGPRGCSTSG